MIKDCWYIGKKKDNGSAEFYKLVEYKKITVIVNMNNAKAEVYHQRFNENDLAKLEERKNEIVKVTNESLIYELDKIVILHGVRFGQVVY